MKEQTMSASEGGTFHVNPWEEVPILAFQRKEEGLCAYSSLCVFGRDEEWGKGHLWVGQVRLCRSEWGTWVLFSL